MPSQPKIISTRRLLENPPRFITSEWHRAVWRDVVRRGHHKTYEAAVKHYLGFVEKYGPLKEGA